MLPHRVKERFSETESFQEARTTWKEKVELLETHLEQERKELKKGIGETGELKARCDSLKLELEEAKRQLEEARDYQKTPWAAPQCRNPQRVQPRRGQQWMREMRQGRNW